MDRLNPERLFDSRKVGFSQITRSHARHIAFISGQFSCNSDGQVIGETLKEQITQTFRNIRIAIEEAGAAPSDVAKTQILIVDHTGGNMIHLENEVRKLFGKKLPAGTLIPVKRLALDGILFEMDATILRE